MIKDLLCRLWGHNPVPLPEGSSLQYSACRRCIHWVRM